MPNLDEIYQAHVSYVWRALRHLGIAPQDLNDITHDIFVTVHRRLPTFEGRSSLRSWIYGICIRTASDYRKRAFRKAEVAEERPPEGVSEPSQEHATQRKALREQLGIVLGQLTQEQREVVVLFEIEGVAMKEIAEIVGCPLHTAYSRLKAARSTMKQKLQAKGITP